METKTEGFKEDGKYAVWGLKDNHVPGPTIDGIPVSRTRLTVNRVLLSVWPGARAFEPGWRVASAEEKARGDYTPKETGSALRRAIQHAGRRLYEWSVDRSRGYWDE